MQKLRIAVVGAGRLGGFHAQKLAARNDVELVAVVDPLAANCQRVAGECKTAALKDYTDLLAHIDAAVIAAPTSLHHRIARDFLDAGVHLLVEKPLCASRAQADELVAAARQRGVVLQVGHVERFNPAFHAAAEMFVVPASAGSFVVPASAGCDAGTGAGAGPAEAGTTNRTPKYIDAVRTSGFTFRSTDVGVVLDVMIHDIDLVLSLVGSPVRKVDALGFSVLGGHEDVANARLEFECGCVATLSASRVSYEQVRRMQVWSAEGFAAVDFAARTATLVRPSETLRRRQFDVDALKPEQVEHCRQHFAEEHLPKQTLTFDAVDALALEQDDFLDSIRTGREPRVNGEAGRDALAVAEQILARIDAHCWDASLDGPAGPLGLPRRHVIPAPHFAPAARRAVS